MGRRVPHHGSQMSTQSTSPTRAHTGLPASLTIWAGGKQVDEYQLDPVQVTTIGRHPVCTVSLNDTLCSRHHSEIFLAGDGWVIRDLDSRNGTFVNRERIIGDWNLSGRSVIHVGNSVLLFTLSPGETVRAVDTVVLMDTFQETGRVNIPSPDGHIISEAVQSRYRLDVMSDERQEDLAHGLNHLYRMALETAAATSRIELAETVLDRVLDATRADIGAVLMCPDGTLPTSSVDGELVQFAFRSRAHESYEVVSASLSRRTLAEKRAVLAHYVLNGSEGAGLSRPSDSIAEIDARSVICAPIRHQETTWGLLHVYSTSTTRELDDDDLHLTLAAADHLALAAHGLAEREDLMQQLSREKSANQSLRDQLAEDSLLIGESESIGKLREVAHRVAPTDATVLIRGESGVGKELVARTIHQSSRRAGKPFVCMNCAALAESLLESELFGHEEGAFTGAVARKVGRFEQANGGTLFLDEVGEMSLSVQAKFLRVLEGHPFERVGGTEEIHVDVRVVAATNRNLEEAVKTGGFRQDLYFRLHVMQILIDPLRDRSSDVLVLTDAFLERFAQKAGVPKKELTPEAATKLKDYHWPGNVRELQNTIERAMILSSGQHIEVDDIRLSSLDLNDDGSMWYNRTLQGNYREVSLERLEFEHIMTTLDYTDWNKTRAAEILQIERSTLDRKLKRAGVQRPEE